MTKEELRKLGARALAARGWRRMPGMSGTVVSAGIGRDGFRLIEPHGLALSEGADALVCEMQEDAVVVDPDFAFFPDLSDPATLGCVLALVREVWGDPDIFVKPNEDGDCEGWLCAAPLAEPWFGNTEAEALVAALEAAPCGQ